MDACVPSEMQASFLESFKMNTFKIIGMVDGAVLAVVTGVGELVPSIALYCHIGIII